MKKIRKKLRTSRGMTLVEMVAAAGVLALLGLMLHTGLLMAQDSYRQITAQAHGQMLLSTVTDLLTNELRYSRNVVTLPDGSLQRYTSVNYGRNTTLALNDAGQLEADGRQMLSTGAYGNGDCRIERLTITYDSDTGIFAVSLGISCKGETGAETTFSIRSLNGAVEGG